MIGIICALEPEAKRLKSAIQRPRARQISGIEYVSGLLCNQDVVVAVCGMGKVFAAVCTQTMILTYKPDLIINTGIAGALVPELKISDIVVAEKVLQHDVDTSALGDPAGSIAGLGRIFLHCNERAVDLMQRAASDLGSLKCHLGSVASGDQFICTKEQKAAIHETFGALACEMESGAIGHVCYMNDIGFCVLRAISDCADESSSIDYNRFLQTAADISCLVMERFLYEWN